jgi:hypothetical protein
MPVFEVGQEVAIDYGARNAVWNGQRYRIARVTRVTPSGQVVIRAGAAELRFKDGRMVGGSGTCLVEASDMVRAEILRAELLARLKAVNWASLDTATLERIAAALP